ncbi:hypothetical protein R1flu_011387 [Riccia fluitans]|uniref:Essential protein Yae1 N-terminal domain-containing protein n=1 Tax=Riccia fluitans TaxID=41844 RepID=A0ABD1Z7M8_9MARC
MDPSRGSAGTSVEAEEDLWEGDDEDLGHYSQTDADLQREWEARRHHFHTLGYRDGISAGKESEAQAGFNVGFKEAVVAGYSWGVARGAASAFSALASSLKGRLVTDHEAMKRIQSLNLSAASISSDEALRLYYEESILRKGVTTVSDEEPSVAGLVISSFTSEAEPSVCCGGRDECNVRASGSIEGRPCSNSIGSSAVSVSTDEDTISDVGNADEIRTTDRPEISLAAARAETSNVSGSSRPSTRLEVLQAEVEKVFNSSVIKLHKFPE